MQHQYTSSTTSLLALAAILLLLSACTAESHTHDTSTSHHHQGEVGEPGTLSFVTTTDSSFQFSEAYAANVTITISHCDGTDDSITSTESIDMATPNSTDISPGGVCLLLLELQELTLIGEWVSGGGFTFVAPLVTTELWAAMPFYTDDTSFLFELGGDTWPTSAELLLTENTVETLHDDSASYEILLEALEMRSLIYRDVDGDGLLSEVDLEKSPVAMTFENTGGTTE